MSLSIAAILILTAMTCPLQAQIATFIAPIKQVILAEIRSYLAKVMVSLDATWTTIHRIGLSTRLSNAILAAMACVSSIAMKAAVPIATSFVTKDLLVVAQDVRRRK